MPEKLQKVSDKPAVVASARGFGPSTTHPELALLAFSIITDWSLLEAAMSALFVKMLGANPLPGAAMYASLTSTSAQKAALRAVASSSLPTNHQDVFEALLVQFGSAAKERNKIAHWLWGVSADLPDCLLLTNPATFTKHAATISHFAHEEKDVRLTFPEDEIYVWRAKDFKAVIKQVHDVMRYLTLFDEAISEAAPFRPDSPDIALRKLQNEAPIRAALLRQQKRQRSGP